MTKGKPYIRFTVNTPLEACEKVRQAIIKAGGGEINNYRGCSFSVRGEGRCLPNNEASPHIGTANILSMIEEEKIESFCNPEKIDYIVAAIKAAHPYEEPAIAAENIMIY